MELERNIKTSFVSSAFPPLLISPCSTFILILTVAVNGGVLFPTKELGTRHPRPRARRDSHCCWLWNV